MPTLGSAYHDCLLSIRSTDAVERRLPDGNLLATFDHRRRSVAK